MTISPLVNHKLTPELQKLSKEIIDMAAEYGLTFFGNNPRESIKFVLVSPSELNAVAAYTGFPARIPHWSYGMEYENLHKKYQYGVSKIYELVINTDPAIAYLLNTNTLVEQKLVMIHVCGHVDFFANNRWFAKTNRQMLDQMSNNASRVKRIMQTRGENEVEQFLDICHSLDNLVDLYGDHIKRQYPKRDEDTFTPEERAVPRLKANRYMDRYINTKDFLDSQKKKLEEEKRRQKQFPEFPERDILGFLIEHAPMERWQKDILAMVREESIYFAPQRMTKIMNEGWATYTHSKFMTGKLGCDHEIVDYCDSQSRAIHQGDSINPYRIGLFLFRDIEDRWNKGRFGPEYDRCESLEKKLSWDLKLGMGKEKVFEVRKTHNDLTFIDEFLTPEFCREYKLFSYKPDQYGNTSVDREFKQVKTHFLQMLANGGQPVIQIKNANFENRGEMLLEHVADGQELDTKKAKDSMENIFKVWTRPVHIETVEQDEEKGEVVKILRSYDGRNHTTRVL